MCKVCVAVWVLCSCAREHPVLARDLVCTMRKSRTDHERAQCGSGCDCPECCRLVELLFIRSVWFAGNLVDCGGKNMGDIPRKPLVSCDCSSFHSESERFPFLDRDLRSLSRASSWLRAQGYVVGNLRFPP